MAVRKKKESAFRRILLNLMEERSMSIRDVAKVAGVSASTIAGWRNGNSPDNFEAIAKLAKYFSLSIGFMLTGRQEEQPNKDSLPVTAVFDQGRVLFSGFARIRIEEFIPKSSFNDEESEIK